MMICWMQNGKSGISSASYDYFNVNIDFERKISRLNVHQKKKADANTAIGQLPARVYANGNHTCMMQIQNKKQT